MKTFWKIILMLWGITFSTSGAEEKIRLKSCIDCTAMTPKTTQICGVCETAKADSLT